MLCAAAYVLMPRDGWRFARPGLKALGAYDRADLPAPDDVALAYAEDLGRDYEENEGPLRCRSKALVVAVVALAIEAVALLYAAAD